MAAPQPDNYQAPTGPIYAGRFATVAAPVAEFIGAPLTGTLPLTTVFTDQSTGSITSRLWTFSDGTTSTSQNPSKVWTTLGPHSVSLTVSGPGGSNTRTRNNYVTPTQASAPPPPPPPPVGTILTTLQAVEETGVGLTAFYEAAVMPLRGAVPAGTTLQSPDDGSLRAAVLSTWDDGSAQMVVLGGSIAISANSTRSIRLQAGAPVVEAPLTAARFAAVGLASTSVGFSVGGDTFVAALNPAATPTRIWWASSRHICASWTVPVPGLPGLAVVWMVHAFSDSTAALVECTCENSLVNMSAPADFTPASYDLALVVISGQPVRSITLGASPEVGVHSGTRGWHASGWTNGGRGVRVTQSHTDLQQHPLFPRIEQAPSWPESVYATDDYTPWDSGRQRPTDMGAGGDHPSIGPLPQWEMRALQSGRPSAWRATEANALACLGYNINTRDSSTGLVPTFAAIGTRWQASGWPRFIPAGATSAASGVMGWETAHCPAVGLMAFLSRPSPVFIELAQKAAVWNGTYSASNNPGGFTWSAGVFGRWYQPRGRGWGIRSLTHASVMLPATDPWRVSAANALSLNANYLTTYYTASAAGARGVLQHMWDISSNNDAPFDTRTDKVGFQIDWTHYYLSPEVMRAASMRLLSGPQQAQLDALADWMALGAVRWVNEQGNGGWRYIPSRLTIGSRLVHPPGHPQEGQLSGNGIDSAATWALERGRADNHPGAPPTVTGTWMSSADNNECPLTYAEYVASTSAAYYPAYFWAVLVLAVERGVAGAAQAMQTVLGGITNMPAWRATFGGDPRWGSWPRNYVAPGWGTGTETGTYNPATRLWTPARDGSGIVNAASVALLPLDEFVQVDGTRLDGLDPVVKAAVPGWTDPGASDWLAVLDNWVGFAYDTRPGQERSWLPCSGGHFDGANTGVYSFDDRRMRWDVDLMPIDPAFIDTRWNISFLSTTPGFSSFTQYVPAWYYYIANEDNPEGVYYDEHWTPDNADPRFSTRRPMPRHTYGSPVFVPGLGAAGKIIFACRRYWEYDVATKTFSIPKFPFGNQTNFTGLRGYTGENMDGWWNDAEQRYYVASTQADGAGYTFSAQPGGTNWRNEGAYPIGGYPSRYKAVEQIGTTLHTLRYAGTSDPGFNAPGRPHSMLITNLATRATTTNPITLGTSFAGRTFATEAPEYWDTQGMTFVAPRNAYLCVVKTVQDGEVLAWINASTWVCELANIPGIGTVRRLENKIKYWPSMGLVTLIDQANINVRVMRIA